MPKSYTTGFFAGAAAMLMVELVPNFGLGPTVALSTAIIQLAFTAGAFFSGE